MNEEPERVMHTERPLSAIVSLPRHHRIALLTDGYSTPFLAKTAISLLRYRSEDIVGLIDRSTHLSTTHELLGVGGSIPVTNLSGMDAVDAIYVGIAPPGGKLPNEWRGIICDGLRRGIDVVSGLHDFLIEDTEYQRLAAANQCELIDVRRNRFKSTASGQALGNACIRIHSVGHDCSVGKMVSSIEMQRGLAAKGYRAKFLATGQTGIMISGEGVPIDCIVADFVNGAAEELVARDNAQDFLLIEGQGSIAHPAFSAVTAGLLHGCAPHGLVFCYEARRDYVKGLDGIPIVALGQQMQALDVMANLRNPCKFIGIAINTRTLSADEAEAEVERAEKEFGLPACDVYRHGPEKLLAAAEQLRGEVLGS